MASINILCGRLGSSTYQDPRTTVLIWDTGAPFGLTPFKVNLLIMWSVILLWRALQKKIPSLVLEQQFISLLMQMENMYYYLAFLIISQPRMCDFSLHKLIISFMVRTPSLKDPMLKLYWRTISFSYLSTYRSLIFGFPMIYQVSVRVLIPCT